MGKLKIKGYELRDVAVMQAPVSFVNHRGEANPFVNICNREVYPIFVAPMGSVTDQHNYKTWIENKLTPVVPRTVQKSEANSDGLTFEERMEIAKETFVSVSLKEAQNELMEYLTKNLVGSNGWYKLDKDGIAVPINQGYPVYYICIDIAHGTLTELYDICKELKKLFGSNIVIMTGNVANPAAYSFYADAGISWVRCGIGGGQRCTSSCNVSIHMGLATLIDMMNEERKAYAHSHNGNAPTKIIADGGIGWFDDIQKAIALGADAVMCGKIFAECEEACEPIYWSRDERTACNKDCRVYEPVNTVGEGWKRFRDYYGMSTKRAQKLSGGNGNKTSEGIDKPVEVKYPVAKWIDNMQSYLRSCMTYTNSRTIKEMQENAQVIILGGSGDAAYRK